MFERFASVDLPCTIGPYSNNMSVYYHEPRFVTYVAVCGKYQVVLLQFDAKFKLINTESYLSEDTDNHQASLTLQAKLVAPTDRNLPLLVVLSLRHLRVYDVKNQAILFSCLAENVREPIQTPMLNSAEPEQEDDGDDELNESFKIQNCELYNIDRGITCVDNIILIGNHKGELTQLHCTDSTVALKKPISAHDNPVVVLATCAYDHITLSGDVTGDVAVWSRNLKQITKRISTGHCLSTMNILRKQALCGTFMGQILLYSVLTGELMAEVSAHSREITSISVAPESAYMLTSSHDSNVCVWKLHTRKPEAYSVEFRDVQHLPNNMLTSTHFANGRGNAFITSAFDTSKLNIYRIVKKQP